MVSCFWPLCSTKNGKLVGCAHLIPLFLTLVSIMTNWNDFLKTEDSEHLLDSDVICLAFIFWSSYFYCHSSLYINMLFSWLLFLFRITLQHFALYFLPFVLLFVVCLVCLNLILLPQVDLTFAVALLCLRTLDIKNNILITLG